MNFAMIPSITKGLPDVEYDREWHMQRIITYVREQVLEKLEELDITFEVLYKDEDGVLFTQMFNVSELMDEDHKKVVCHNLMKFTAETTDAFAFAFVTTAYVAEHPIDGSNAIEEGVECIMLVQEFQGEGTRVVVLEMVRDEGGRVVDLPIYSDQTTFESEGLFMGILPPFVPEGAIDA